MEKYESVKIRGGILADQQNYVDTFITTIVKLDKNIFTGIPAEPKFITGRRTFKTEQEVFQPEMNPVVNFRNISHRLNKALANLTNNDLNALLELGETLQLTNGVKVSDAQVLTQLNEMYRTDIETLMHIEGAYNFYV
jgi:hypothetical protein